MNSSLGSLIQSIFFAILQPSTSLNPVSKSTSFEAGSDTLASIPLIAMLS